MKEAEVGNSEVNAGPTQSDCDQPLFSAIVVVYNEDIRKSPSVSFLTSCSDDSLEVVICDNSDDEHNDNAAASKEMNCIYLDMGGNAGLSKAYNRAVESAHGKYICVFDDDTTIDEQFFSRMKHHIESHPLSIIVPAVIANGIPFSPIEIRHYRHKSISNYDIPCLNMSAINTGMVIPRAVFQSCRYNESMFLDCIDHDLIRQAKSERFDLFFAKDVVLMQDYSRDSDSFEQSMARLRIFFADNKVYCSDSFGHKLFGVFSKLYTKIKYAVRFKSLKFLGL